MKFVARCKQCGGTALFAGFVTMPSKCVFFCATCNHHTWLDGKPDSFDRTPAQQQQQQSDSE